MYIYNVKRNKGKFSAWSQSVTSLSWRFAHHLINCSNNFLVNFQWHPLPPKPCTSRRLVRWAAIQAYPWSSPPFKERSVVLERACFLSNSSGWPRVCFLLDHCLPIMPPWLISWQIASFLDIIKVGVEFGIAEENYFFSDWKKKSKRSQEDML